MPYDAETFAAQTESSASGPVVVLSPIEIRPEPFQERVLEIMVRRIFAAAREREVRRMVVAGGVAANGRLRELLAEEKRPDETVIMPSPALCTDNAAMVAGIGYHYFLTGRSDDRSVDVHARV